MRKKAFQLFTKHFLNSRYEYANEWVDDVIVSLCSHILYINFENINLLLKHVKVRHHIKYVGVNIILHLFEVDI